MSFFISDSLKGIISEEDISITDTTDKVDEEKVYIELQSDLPTTFKLRLLSMRFDELIDEIVVVISNESLNKLFSCHNQKINYSISLDHNRHMTNYGILVIKELEINKDNYVTCQIVINK
tara:strand:+ start:36 stop:395 length:360 start_codon:yes stop_codon:yes gene_type:complete